MTITVGSALTIVSDVFTGGRGCANATAESKNSGKKVTPWATALKASLYFKQFFIAESNYPARCKVVLSNSISSSFK
ncbi:MAG: hypothetical protein ACK5WZ_12045 [Pseudobdellovibrionaceae bacterium]